MWRRAGAPRWDRRCGVRAGARAEGFVGDFCSALLLNCIASCNIALPHALLHCLEEVVDWVWRASRHIAQRIIHTRLYQQSSFCLHTACTLHQVYRTFYTSIRCTPTGEEAAAHHHDRRAARAVRQAVQSAAGPPGGGHSLVISMLPYTLLHETIEQLCGSSASHSIKVAPGPGPTPYRLRFR